MRSVNVVLALAASAAATPVANIFERARCNADNCLRALRNTNRAGLPDCSSFLAATVTPATSTIYTTESFTTTATATYEVTDTITNLVTATDIVEQTATEVVTQTVRPAKRQVTETPSDIPTYATACSGINRYTSACFCLGATATTITVDAPTTVITVSETVTPTTVSEYITVHTAEVAVTAATQTITTIVATTTLTEEVPIATDGPFRVKVINHPEAGGSYLQYTSKGGTELFLTASKTISAAQSSRFIINAANGKIMSGGKHLEVSGVSGLSVPRSSGMYYTYPFTVGCVITPANRLNCASWISGAGGLYYCQQAPADKITIHWSRANENEHPGCQLLELAVEY